MEEYLVKKFFGSIGRILLSIIAGLIILAISIMLYFRSGFFNNETNASSTSTMVEDSLVELSEWATLKFEYQNVIVSRTDKSFSVANLPEITYGEAIKLIEYSGYLKAGTDLSQVEVSYNEDTDHLTVKIPKATILDNVVETENITVEDVKGNILSDYDDQLIFDEINENKAQTEKEKVEEGLLDDADKRVVELLTSFLTSNGYESVTVEFK